MCCNFGLPASCTQNSKFLFLISKHGYHICNEYNNNVVEGSCNKFKTRYKAGTKHIQN